MKIYFIIVILISLMLFSCSKEENRFNLFFLKNINFEVLDSTNGKYYYYIIFHEKSNDKEYFVWLNNLSNSIDFFDIENGKFDFCITFNPNFKIFQFFIHNLDSIFALENRKNHIGLFNRKGEFVKEYLYERTINQPISVKPAISEDSPFLYRNKRFYYLLSPTEVIDVEEYIKLPKLAIININNEKHISVLKTMFFPDKYHDTLDYNFYKPSYCLTKNADILASFEVSHELYLINNNGEVIKSINAKSKFIDEFNIVDKSKSSKLSYNKKFRVISPHYGGVYYDKYRNLYYRIAIHKQPVFDDKGKVNHIGDNPWSIIVFDEKLKMLDEIFIEGKKYYPHIFITKKGLLLLDLQKFYSKKTRNVYYFKLMKIEAKN